MDPTLIIFLLLMIGMMWFMTNRGKKRVAAERQRLEETLVPGTSVMTIGGFLGRIVDLDGDVVTLESPSGVETIWMRNAIKEVKEPPFAVVETDEPEELVADESVVVPDDASALTTEERGSTSGDPRSLGTDAPGTDARGTDAPATDVGTGTGTGTDQDASGPHAGPDDEGHEPGTHRV